MPNLARKKADHQQMSLFFDEINTAQIPTQAVKLQEIFVQPLKFIDLFAGIGGFHQALHNQGAKCVFAAEWDNKCRETYEYNFKKISPKLFELDNFAGDLTQIEPKSIPDHDILCAGFPCQPFSISGKQKGFEDTRGTLFFNVLEIIEAKQPKVVFLENVKHLVHHDNGNTLRVILEKLEELGYLAEWKVLNAKDFGLAQNRERIIIIANKQARFNFKKIKHTQNTIIKDILDTDSNFEYLKEDEYTLLPENLVKEQKSGLIFCGYRNKTIRTSGVRPNTEHLSRVHKQPNRIYHINGTHPTLPSQEASGRFFIYDGKGVRKLTIDECYKLQGFPKSFQKNQNLAACYNQIGNSVAIPMIEAIFSQIKEQYFECVN
ncbi:DNA (cytosine-5-)-methyltransferase [Actinobacillus equuli subsp. equuli]|uniref:Cytosine-specific methyltransferase n=1 Tax=Actinobacillus equuli subsp. equuli TaxID=202947 RepID=A0A9X4G3V2_ACTEU|nr:DNA (cytosine-5-)-methyltransferase [Actinobacillus equuli]MDE8035287.1 DNA (cytosine-5-)-methyltransferase [Actinobacillus equuli subsp. equuli]MDG4948364.1 DNA (cytosine-5-)-methyltransferase [Actinobacillus equuli subsp. haemolyticus]